MQGLQKCFLINYIMFLDVWNQLIDVDCSRNWFVMIVDFETMLYYCLLMQKLLLLHHKRLYIWSWPVWIVLFQSCCHNDVLLDDHNGISLMTTFVHSVCHIGQQISNDKICACLWIRNSIDYTNFAVCDASGIMVFIDFDYLFLEHFYCM
jgi:hypothetical protein